MNTTWKDSYILKKFRTGMLMIFAVMFLIVSLSGFLITKHFFSEQIKKDVVKQFMGVNKNIITSNSTKIYPITAGILEGREIVYIVKETEVIYKSKTNKSDNDRDLELIIAKSPTQKNPIEVKLYIDMKKRVNNYLKVYYIFLIPLIFIFGLVITLFAISRLYNLTERLYRFIDNVKDFEGHGVDFNRIKVYNSDDEVGILSKEFDKLSKELVRMRHKERQFVNDASHELKTPLAIIEGNLALLDKKGYSEESKSMVKENIKSTIFDMKAVIDNMMDLVHEEIIVKDKIESENVSEILGQVVEDYKIIYSDFTFKTDFDSVTYPILKLDLVKLANILFENAVKYSTEDLKEIEIKLKQKGEKIFFSVTDYGIGIAPENVSKVFDKFWREDTSRSRTTGGAGLGLSIAKKICEKYNFKIHTSSTLNMGTTVMVEMN